MLDDGSLRIDAPSDNDAGEYECMAKSTAGEAKSRPARLVRTTTIVGKYLLQIYKEIYLLIIFFLQQILVRIFYRLL